MMRSLAQLKALVVPLLALCAQVSAKHDTMVNSQIRLAYVGDTAMRVSWSTFDKVDRPVVFYGKTPSALVHAASSDESVTYNTSSVYANHVTIEGLEPDTVYYYSLPQHLIYDNEAHAQPPFSFRTSRSPGDMTPYSVAVVIDMGTMGHNGLTTSAGQGVNPNNILRPGEQNTIQSLDAVKDDYEFIFYPGDFAYADDWLDEESEGFLPNTTIQEGYEVYQSINNDFYDEMTKISTVKPWMVGAGNHEASCIPDGVETYNGISYNASLICQPGLTNFTGYRNHWRMPFDVSGGQGNFWYSFDNGMVHWIMLDTETDLGDGFIGPDQTGGVEKDIAGPFGPYANAQLDWLKKDLASVDRTITPWIIVGGHRPWYLSYANQSTTICWDCKDVFEPLFLEYAVDLYLSGHAHFYQRSAPLNNSVIDPRELDNPTSPWYITNGAAGHYDGLSEGTNPPAPYERFRLDERNATYGWSKLTFHNRTHLTHQFVASGNGSILDTATLYKEH
ncbi:metallo-phosphoesterase [Penicillium lagena]|uniref:metallo-phosphoesterase n=1 Tax=Penicillium lagena TaxID=94218 RepID=UPI00254162A8|nr:metallo-phosphoesterase [Penicillium lagena]KAJ5601594.1 metallo-phosphoesterase [Penicillium lagena]